jgi:hypothetical protein
MILSSKWELLLLLLFPFSPLQQSTIIFAYQLNCLGAEVNERREPEDLIHLHP